MSGINFLHAKTTRALPKQANHPRRGWSLWEETLGGMVSRVDLTLKCTWFQSVALFSCKKRPPGHQQSKPIIPGGDGFYWRKSLIYHSTLGMVSKVDSDDSGLEGWRGHTSMGLWAMRFWAWWQLAMRNEAQKTSPGSWTDKALHLIYHSTLIWYNTNNIITYPTSIQ